MNPSAIRTAPNRSLSAAWFALALAALGLSALFAVILVVARTPFLGQGAELFRTALVLHVDLAVQVWFLAMAAGLWSLAVQQPGVLRWAAFALAAAGTVALVAAAVPGDATPLLTNYIPLLDHPLFYAGLCLLLGGVACSAALSLPGLLRRPIERWRLPAAGAVLAVLGTALVVLINFFGPVDWMAAESLSLDDQLWGVGHGLQFVHVLLLMAAWSVLGEELLAASATKRQAQLLAFILALLPALAVPLIALLVPLGTVEQRALYTDLMRWGAWPGAVLLGGMIAAGLVDRVRHGGALSDEQKGLALSLFLFGAGCLLGTLIRGESLAVPAHYHGTVGAITLAYLLWLRRLAAERWIGEAHLAPLRRLPLAYGSGIAVLAAGLAIAGYLGVPRKSTHVDLSVDSGAYFAAMGAAGIGGFVALTAVAAMAVFGFRAVYRTRRGVGSVSQRKRDMRWMAIATTVFCVLALGWLLERAPGAAGSDRQIRRQHAADKTRQEIDQRFQQGVMMLHAKQYDHALTSFHRVMQLAPNMPEAYVNTGYALLGMKRYKEAYDFFESATQLRRSQANAYFGMAEALEGMGDLPGALGAMRSFVHLAKANDPYRTKAESAIWEWSARLEAERNKAPARK